MKVVDIVRVVCLGLLLQGCGGATEQALHELGGGESVSDGSGTQHMPQRDSGGERESTSTDRSVTDQSASNDNVSDINNENDDVGSPEERISTAPLTIANMSNNQSVTEGGSVEFSVIASSGRTISYQWYYNGTLLSGQTGASLSLVELSLSHGGNYHVTVSDGVTEWVSSPVELSVLPLSTLVDLEVTWKAPLIREDGSALDSSDIVNYQLYLGASEESMQLVQTVEPVTQATLKGLDLDKGTYVLAVSAIDAFGIQSKVSSPIVLKI